MGIPHSVVHRWKIGDQKSKAMSTVCGRLRGDAIIAAQEAGFDNLCEIVDERPCGIEALISHMLETVFPSTEYEPQRLCCQHCRSEGLLSRKNAESVEQCLATTT